MSVAAIVIATARAPWSGAAMAMLPWGDDQTLIEFHIAQLQAAGVYDIEVVLGHDADRVIPLFAADNVEPIVNERWAVDPASSLRAGASAVVRGTTAAFVVDVAEPRSAHMLRAVIVAHEARDAEITLTIFNGKRCMPIILGETALAALRNIHGEQDLWSVVDRYGDTARMVDMKSAGAGDCLRIDSREEYERAREAIGGR